MSIKINSEAIANPNSPLTKNASKKRNSIKIITRIILATIFVTSVAYFLLLSKPHFEGRVERGVAEMYDKDDLGACTLFAGNFINFGFWDQQKLNSNNTFSVSDRIESEKNLYRLVLTKLNISNNDKLLEVACGQGVGSALALNEFHPKEMHGIDFSKAQISRAQKINATLLQQNADKFFFHQSDAEHTTYPNNYFDKVFSIEAAQHFSNIEKFVTEANRILKSNGKLVVATFFGTSNTSKKPLSEMIPTIKDGIDNATSIYLFESMLKKHGFKNIKIESIGKNVWPGFDRWTAQGDFKNSWTRNWYKGYQKGLIDYFVISAEKN